MGEIFGTKSVLGPVGLDLEPIVVLSLYIYGCMFVEGFHWIKCKRIAHNL